MDEIFKTYALVSVLAKKEGREVIRVRHRKLGKDLVLRTYPEPCPAYEILCGIRCENLPEIYDAVTLSDGQAVLEEYIDGMSVFEVMASGRYRYRGAAKVIRGVCAALSVLHENGLVHRDVKPENVMIASSGRVVLIDFDAARRENAAKKDTVTMGTVGFASPELGIAPTDARSDIYNTGVMLNLMLTGKHPSESLARGKAGRIVKKCLNINRDERYQSAEKLAAAL